MFTPEHYLRVSAAVTQLLSESENLVATLEDALKLLATEFAWDAASFWRADYEAMLLRCACHWSAAGEFPSFAIVTRARTFAIGTGLPGSVWMDRQSRWFRDVTRHQNFPRASVAEAEGLHTGVGFPVLQGTQVLGVCEFFSRKIREEDPILMEFFLSTGRQMGLFLQRVRAEEALTGAEAQFELLAQSAVDAIITIDEESTILFVNAAAEKIFGYSRDAMHGRKLTMLMPDYLRHVHEHALQRYVETGQRHVSWDGVQLPALHRDGHEFPVEIAFGEIIRGGKRYFSGYVRVPGAG